MTCPIMPDIRHSSLAWMMTIAMVLWHGPPLVGTSGNFQMRVVSLLPLEADGDPAAAVPCLGRSHGNGRERTLGVVEEAAMVRPSKNCSVRVWICLSHHLLPLPRDVQCTLGEITQEIWRPQENAEIPFSFKWPGALTVSVTATCDCQQGNPQANRTIGHLVFAHGILPTRNWTRIPHHVTKPGTTGSSFDFTLPPSPEPEVASQTSSAISKTSLLHGGLEPSMAMNTASHEHIRRGLEVKKKMLGTDSGIGTNLNIPVGLEIPSKLVAEDRSGSKMAIQTYKNGIMGQRRGTDSKSDDVKMVSRTGHPSLEVVGGVDDDVGGRNDLGRSKIPEETKKKKEEEEDEEKLEKEEEEEGKEEEKEEGDEEGDEIVVDVIPTEMTSVSRRTGQMAVIFRVACHQHYFGDGCSDFCRPKDDMFGHFRCSQKGEKLCLDGWAGPRCTIAVCRQQCPPERGFCSNPDECTCKPGWYGLECEYCRTALGCRHGRCGSTPGQCLCHRGWTGHLCDVESQYCVDNQPCQHNGRCVQDLSHNYTCVCTPGYTGTNCQVPVCHDYFCLHGGTCMTSEGTRYCLCPKPFKGPRCQHVDYNEAADVVQTTHVNKPDIGLHRKGKGSAASLTSSASNSNQNGRDDEICDYDDGAVIACQNGGKCVRSSRSDGSYGCSCPEPFEGEFCETDRRDPCQEYVCAHRGRCKVNGDGEPYCLCRHGFSGDFCERKSTICTRQQFCENGGTCVVMRRRKYKCVCRNNFFGKRCENKATGDVAIVNHRNNTNKNNNNNNSGGGTIITQKVMVHHVWTVRMSSSKESCASSRPHNLTSGIVAVLLLFKIVHKLAQFCACDL